MLGQRDYSIDGGARRGEAGGAAGRGVMHAIAFADISCVAIADLQYAARLAVENLRAAGLEFLADNPGLTDGELWICRQATGDYTLRLSIGYATEQEIREAWFAPPGAFMRLSGVVF